MEPLVSQRTTRWGRSTARSRRARSTSSPPRASDRRKLRRMSMTLPRRDGTSLRLRRVAILRTTRARRRSISANSSSVQTSKDFRRNTARGAVARASPVGPRGPLRARRPLFRQPAGQHGQRVAASPGQVGGARRGPRGRRCRPATSSSRQQRSKTASKRSHTRRSIFRLVRSPSLTSSRSPMSTCPSAAAASISSPGVTGTPTPRSSPRESGEMGDQIARAPLRDGSPVY